MYYIRLKGRLGNQLFIYAFARKLVAKYGKQVLIYDRKDEKDSKWYSHLDNYRLNNNIQFTSNKKLVMNFNISSKLLFAYDRILGDHMNPRQKNTFQRKRLNLNLKHGLFLLQDGYADFPDNLKDGTFFDGYFQSPRYFDDIRDELKKELTPQYKFNSKEEEFLNQIENTESVCITIRLGDYLNNDTHQVCTKRFYINAMKKMKELHPNAKFFIFSDEINKAKDIFDFPYPVIYDSGKMKDYASLFTMSKCKHFIISNSSFSWWAQYLSNNAQKTVIAPDRWYAQDVPCDIYEDNWILMKGK